MCKSTIDTSVFQCQCESVTGNTRESLLQWFKDLNREPPKVITCDTCEQVDDCKYAYDPFNTEGDCLNE